jgi:DNA-binding NarL/FixJ family response regulator
MDGNGVAEQTVQCCCCSEHFTPREIQVLCLVATGLSNTGIAERLHLSSHTIDRHLGDMLRRSSVNNRAALVARAYYAGVLVADGWPPAETGRRCLRQ